MALQPAPRQLVKGMLGPINASSQQFLRFQYNPREMRRSRRATYANNTASRADFPNTRQNQGQPIEWIRNEAEDLAVELYFHEDGDKNIEQQLKQLDTLMAPDPSTGEPRDLLIIFGVRSDRCRILEKDVTEKLFNPTLNVQEATVSLKLKLLTSRSGGGG